MLNLLRKDPKKKDDQPQVEPGSREDKEIKLKTRAGFVINVFALFLAVNTWYGGKLSSTVMNDTIAANDTFAFYQAKSIKQILAQQSLDDAVARGDKAKIAKLEQKIEDYESDPKDGKKALMAKARTLEAERDIAKQRTPWIGYANTAYQLSIVLLSASIISVSMPLFFGSFVVAGLGLLLSLQGVYLWI
jgi:hypothetical protein